MNANPSQPCAPNRLPSGGSGAEPPSPSPIPDTLAQANRCRLTEIPQLPQNVAQALLRVDIRARELPGFKAKLVRLWLDVSTDELRKLSPAQAREVVLSLANTIDGMGRG